MLKFAKKNAASPGGEMPLFDHLAELRRRLIISITSIFVGMCLVFVVYQPILDFLVQPYQESCEQGELDTAEGEDDADTAEGEDSSDGDGRNNCELLQTDPLEGFNVRIKVSMYGGIALAMPVLLWHLWRFVSPGLYSNEKRYALPFIGSALALFTMGATLAYWMLPRALDFLGAIGGSQLNQEYAPGKYLGLITYMMLAFGAGFQVPVLMVFLQMAGIVDPSTLRNVRRYAIVAIAFLSAIITPTGDPITMVTLMVPMYVFYELAILIGSWFARRTARSRI